MNVVILRCRNFEEENWKIYIKPSFSACTCRTTLIQSALDSPDPGAYSKYPHHGLNIHRKFSTCL